MTGIRCFKEVSEHIRMIKESGLPLTISITPDSYLGVNVFETIRTAKGLNDRLLISSALFDPREETGKAGQETDLDPAPTVEYVTHKKLKQMTRDCKAVIRTGETTPYSNIILQSGCIF